MLSVGPESSTAHIDSCFECEEKSQMASATNLKVLLYVYARISCDASFTCARKCHLWRSDRPTCLFVKHVTDENPGVVAFRTGTPNSQLNIQLTVRVLLTKTIDHLYSLKRSYS